MSAVAPGCVDEPLLRDRPLRLQWMLLARTPAGGLGTPAGVAAAPRSPASGESSCFVGQVPGPGGDLDMEERLHGSRRMVRLPAVGRDRCGIARGAAPEGYLDTNESVHFARPLCGHLTPEDPLDILPRFARHEGKRG